MFASLQGILRKRSLLREDRFVQCDRQRKAAYMFETAVEEIEGLHCSNPRR